jgi:hypothetical protein
MALANKHGRHMTSAATLFLKLFIFLLVRAAFRCFQAATDLRVADEGPVIPKDCEAMIARRAQQGERKNAAIQSKVT